MRPAATGSNGGYRTFQPLPAPSRAGSRGGPGFSPPAVALLLRSAARNKEEQPISPDSLCVEFSLLPLIRITAVCLEHYLFSSDKA